MTSNAAPPAIDLKLQKYDADTFRVLLGNKVVGLLLRLANTKWRGYVDDKPVTEAYVSQSDALEEFSTVISPPATSTEKHEPFDTTHEAAAEAMWNHDGMGAWLYGREDEKADYRALAKVAVEAAKCHGWQPVETAPREPHVPLDLWVIPGKPLCGEKAKPYRATNAYVSGNRKHWLSSDGRYLEGRRYYEDGDECFDPDDRGPDASHVTHWRYPPGAPSD